MFLLLHTYEKKNQKIETHTHTHTRTHTYTHTNKKKWTNILSDTQLICWRKDRLILYIVKSTHVNPIISNNIKNINAKIKYGIAPNNATNIINIGLKQGMISENMFKHSNKFFQ